MVKFCNLIHQKHQQIRSHLELREAHTEWPDYYWLGRGETKTDESNQGSSKQVEVSITIHETVFLVLPAAPLSHPPLHQQWTLGPEKMNPLSTRALLCWIKLSCISQNNRINFEAQWDFFLCVCSTRMDREFTPCNWLARGLTPSLRWRPKSPCFFPLY